MGSGVGGGGGGWEAEGRLKQPSSSAVPSVWDLNWYDPQSGPRLPLGAVWYPMQSYYCPSGPRNASSWFKSIGKKPSMKADLAIYGQVLGVSG